MIYDQSRGINLSALSGKGFHETFFDCVHDGVESVIGGEATKTFDYAIQQRTGFANEEVRKKPLEVIQELRIILGKTGFEMLEPAIKNSIKETFNIHEKLSSLSLEDIFKIAERNFLKADFASL